MSHKKDHDRLLVMEGADVFDAYEALRNGNERPIGWYLQDAGAVLNRISNLLDPIKQDEQAPRRKFTSDGTLPLVPDQDATVSDDALEWVSSRSQIEAAINAGHARLLGWYLRDLGDFLTALAPAFDPPERFRDWRLQLVRKGRGRRSDPVQQMLVNSALAMKLRMKTRDAGKQEAAIKDLEKSAGMSRATIFRRTPRRTRKAP